MKTCACGKKIKNEFRSCFSCNDSLSGVYAPGYKYSSSSSSSSSSSTDKIEKYIKDEIPKAVRNALWINHFKDSRVGLCHCCRREQITISNFHCGHIQAEKEGGKTTLDNLAPICPCCNLSMKTMNMNEFILRYNLHYGL